MVQYKRSIGNEIDNLADSNSSIDHQAHAMNCSNSQEDTIEYSGLSGEQQNTSHEWLKEDTAPVVVYGHHMQMEPYPPGTWCEGWPHPGMPPMMHPAQGDSSGLDKTLAEATNIALAQATAIPEGRVVGVYFDKQRRIWRATWREHGQGKRKTKNFSVDDYGFEEARRMAIQFRLVKLMEASDQALHDQEMMHQGVSTLSSEYKRTLTPTPGSNRRKRRRYGSPDSFAPKIPMWAQTYSPEAALPNEEAYQTSTLWPPLYGHPSAFVHMEHLRNTQQSWASNIAPGTQPCDSRESTVATNDGVLDRADMVSTVDSTIHEQVMKGYDSPARQASGLIC